MLVEHICILINFVLVSRNFEKKLVFTLTVK